MRKLVVLFVLIPALAYAGMGMGPGPGIGRTFGGGGDSVIFSDGSGFEGVFPGNWDSIVGAPAQSTTQVHDGTYSMQVDAAEYAKETLDTTYTEIWYDFWFFCNTDTATTDRFVAVYNSVESASFPLRLSATETVQYYTGSAWITAGTAAAIVGQWVHVFVHGILAAGGSETIEISTNQSATWDAWDYSVTTGSLGPDDFQVIYLGNSLSTTRTTYYDGGFKIYSGSTMPLAWQ